MQKVHEHVDRGRVADPVRDPRLASKGLELVCGHWRLENLQDANPRNASKNGALARVDAT